MTMVLGRNYYRNDPITGGLGRDSRSPLKIPCSRYSYSVDSGKSLYDSGFSSHSYDASSSSSSSSKQWGNVALSTPSPSATANGNRVDLEFEKLRRLSEEWLRNREIEEAENTVWNLHSRSPSPQRGLSPFRRSCSQPPKGVNRDQRSPSPTRSSDRSIRSPSVSKSDNSFHSLRSRSPSPILFSPLSKTFVRSSSHEPDSCQSRSSSPRESSLPPTPYRRNSLLDQEKNYRPSPLKNGSPQRNLPVVSLFRRSVSCDPEDTIRNNFRARSTSPQRLTPASSYYRKHSNSEDRDSGIYSSYYNSRSPSPQTIQHSIDCPYYQSTLNSTSSSRQSDPFSGSSANNLKHFFGTSNSNKFNSLPRNIFSQKSSSPKRETLFDLFTPNAVNRPYNNNYQKNTISNNSTVSTSDRFNNFAGSSFNASKPPLASTTRASDRQFLPNTLPNLPGHKMNTSRRFSEEPSPFRKPLATLHEDDVQARRRFSDDLRKRSFATPDVTKEFNNHQRKLSEAGVRKHSDASLVLTEDTDSFIIGDRIWVGGTKPGSISYIGETQFAPGEWAGVTLDEPIGKNNGSVAGVRYFQCEPKKGVFSRLTRLSRIPLTDQDLEYLAVRQAAHHSTDKLLDSSKPNAAPPTVERKSSQVSDPSLRRPSQPSETLRKVTPASPGTKSPLSPKSGSPSPAGSVKKGPLPSVGPGSEMRIGERVVIDSTSGIKYGVLRYLGRTDFAEGVWAGVELDEPSGKNDGSVAGKKYFVCRSKYGLFAPVGRVRSFGSRASFSRSALPTVRRAGSRESLGASSAASSSISLRGTRRPSNTSIRSSSSTKALQETLAEKTQHVDQLMRERDSDRIEMARIATRLEEATRIAHDYKLQLDQLQIESEERLHDLGEKVQGLECEKREVLLKLEDKRKEIDDLNFRVEEESCAKADFESQSITTQGLVEELERLLVEERKKMLKRGEREARKDDEMEEIEISLRASIEELQARVMESEGEKETVEKQLEEAETKRKDLEAETGSLCTSLKEAEQKITLLEAGTEGRNERMKQLEAELSQVVEADHRDTKIADLKAAEILLQEELAGTRQEMQSLSMSLEESISKVTTLEKAKKGLVGELERAEQLSKKASEESGRSLKALEEVQEELKALKVELEREKNELKMQGELLEKEREQTRQSSFQMSELKDTQRKLQEAERKAESATGKADKVALELEDARDRIGELEKARRGLEGELEVALASSTASSDQLGDAKAKAEQAASQAEEEKRRLVTEVEAKEAALCLLRQKEDDIQAELELKTKDLEAELEEKEREKSRVEEQLRTQLDEQIKNYKNLSDQLETNASSFKEQLDGKAQENVEFTATVASLKDTVSTLEKDKAQILLDKSAQSTLLSNSEEMINQLASQVESLKCQLLSHEENLRKQVAAAEEDQKNMALLRTSMDESQNQLNSLEERLGKVQEEKEKLEAEKFCLDEEVAKLKVFEEKCNLSLKSQEGLEEGLKELHQKNMELERQKSMHEGDLKRVEGKIQELKEQNNSLIKELDTFRVLESQLSHLKNEKESLEAELSKRDSELSQARKETEEMTTQILQLEAKSQQGVEEVEQKSKSQASIIEEFERDKQALSEELSTVRVQLDKMSLLEEQNAELQRVTAVLENSTHQAKIHLEASTEALKKNHSEKVGELEAEKGNLVEEVVSLQDQLAELRQQRESDLSEYREKENVQGEEQTQLAELRLKVLGIESEKRKLEAEVKTLKEHIALVDIGSSDSNEYVANLKQERNQFEEQLDFLNSVIVDLQKKKEDLEIKVEILQAGNLQDDQKANMNGPKNVRALAPRLFCDICDRFDLHDTEDCPKQTSEESVPHSVYNADRHSVRAYCDTCEMFGHEDGECPTDETF